VGQVIGPQARAALVMISAAGYERLKISRIPMGELINWANQKAITLKRKS